MCNALNVEVQKVMIHCYVYGRIAAFLSYSLEGEVKIYLINDCDKSVCSVIDTFLSIIC
jgi:hypothetical protein